MCGIIGVVDKKNKIKTGLKELNDMQNHRGPDESGFYQNDSVGLQLAMTRLSIIDIQGAHQPYISKDGYVVIFNGEIFNVANLSKDISQSDPSIESSNYEAELICILYRKYGEKFLDRLNGMFAIAIYDPKNNSLFIARDRFGIKPLHYLKSNETFCFSSEISPLIECLNGKTTLDYQSIENYFSVGYVPNPSTIYSEIKQLPPGNYMTYDLSNAKLRIKRWWVNIPKIDYSLSIDEWYFEVKNQLQKSMKTWSFSDVPVTYLLSGGLDSSALVAVAAMNSSSPINTYSLGFQGDGEESWSELLIAKDMSKKYGTNHTEIILNSDKLADSLCSISQHLEQPFAGGLPSWAVFEEISKEHRVAIVGTGGDEIFGNYNRGKKFISSVFRGSYNNSINSAILTKGIQEVFFMMNDNQSQEILRNKKKSFELTKKFSNLYYSCQFEEIDDILAQLSFETQLVDDFLMLTDRFSMAHSVEARTPFLDHDLVKLMFSMPTKYKIDYGNYKSALKNSIGHLLPKSVLDSKKHGFNVPLSLWMRGRLRDLVEEMIGKKALNSSQFIKPEFYDLYVKPMLKGDNRYIGMIWQVFMFQFWLKNKY